MRRILRGLATAAMAWLASSCEVGLNDGAPPGVALTPSDGEIASRLYAGTPRTPAGFLADDTPTGFAQVTTYHLKAQPPAAPHELCTDHWSEALAWSEDEAVRAPVYLDLVGNSDTERYFEFDRVPRGQPDRYVRMRVLKCAYLDRSGVDPVGATGLAGVLNVRPLDAAALRGLSEYLWHFTLYNNADHAVLASEPRAAAGGIAHALVIASLDRAANGSCDRIVVREWTHAADTVTGTVELATSTAREFHVHREGGIARGC